MRGLGWFTGLGALLAAATAGAERLPVVPLDGPGLKRVCETVRPDGQVKFTGNEVERGKARAEYRKRRVAALERFYLVTVPSIGFSFREYDVSEKKLTLETRKVLPLADGVELAFAAGDDEPEIAAALGPQPAEQVVLLRGKGKLGLRLTFRLDPGQAGDPCTRSPTRKVVKAAVDPLAFELVELAKVEKTLYRGELPGYTEALQGSVPVKGPKVRLGKPSAGQGEPPAPLIAALRGLEPALLQCYRQGLENNARLRGAIVVGFKLDAGGRVTHASAEINSLGDDEVTACAVARVRAHRFARGVKPGRVSVPVYFQSQDD
ncbi:MAG: AgmX/PglI C-terminal domain-containing protein [Deltaproteobacteria bacterium]|nr:AgmX/PglI C-terminal domain-containing protein [Deltaproteobacteria bacterium]